MCQKRSICNRKSEKSHQMYLQNNKSKNYKPEIFVSLKQEIKEHRKFNLKDGAIGA